MTALTILGGGPAGLALAFYAHRSGRPLRLYEGSSELGGMCRTFSHEGHRYDAGAHRLHDRDSEVTADLRALLGPDLRPVRAPSRVWTRGRFVDFPPTPLNAALSYGIGGAAKIGFELLHARWRPRSAGTFEDFARNRFGATLARGLLLDYSEKLWGLPADRLSPDIATRRLSGMTLRSLLAEMLRPSRKADHLDGSFLYPRLGYGEIPGCLAAALPAGSVLTGHEVSGFGLCGGRLAEVRFADGRAVETPGRVVSTLPLTLLVRLLGTAVPEEARAAAARLLFRQVRLVFLRLDQARVSDNASIYIPDPRICVSRVCEPKNRSADMAPPSETALVAEIPCFAADPVGRLSDGALAERVIGELARIGLLRRERVAGWRHHLLPAAYPVYGMGYEGDVRTVSAALARIPNLDTTGRAGAFRYSHLHEQMRFGKDYVAALPEA